MSRKLFRAIVAQYGIANQDGYILSLADALKMFEQLREQEIMPEDEAGYYINDIAMTGDEKCGAIYATFSFEEEGK